MWRMGMADEAGNRHHTPQLHDQETGTADDESGLQWQRLHWQTVDDLIRDFVVAARRQNLPTRGVVNPHWWIEFGVVGPTYEGLTVSTSGNWTLTHYSENTGGMGTMASSEEHGIWPATITADQVRAALVALLGRGGR
jgi:hypothetical protein